MSAPDLTDKATRERLLAEARAAQVRGFDRDVIPTIVIQPHTLIAALELIGELEDAIRRYLAVPGHDLTPPVVTVWRQRLADALEPPR